MNQEKRITVASWTAAVLGGLVVIGIAVLALWPPAKGQTIDVSRPPSVTAVAVGSVGTHENRAVDEARAFLTVYNTDGVELTRTTLPVDKTGWFQIQATDIPDIADQRAVTVSAEGRRHLAQQMVVTVTRDSAGVHVLPSRIHLRLSAYNPWLTIVVLIPAIFGLILALLHLTTLSRGFRVTQLYAVGTAALWAVVLTLLISVYAQQGNALIALFWPDLFISSGVVVFALIGCLTYVAYSIEQKDRDLLFGGTQREKQHLLLTIGGRILIGPYVALAGYAIFAATFKNLNSGAFAAFFGFFTGVWIKPVLSALNDIGLRLLSKEEQDKIVKLATGEAGPRAPVASAELLVPTPAYLNAVEEARQTFLAQENVLGVGAGTTTNGAGPSERAIVVYVDRKLDIGPDDPRFIPPKFNGYRTDVRQPSPPPGPGICHSDMLSISHDKIAAKNGAIGGTEPQTGPSLSHRDGVWILLDEQKRLFFDTPAQLNFFDAKAAFVLAEKKIGRSDDFVAFVIDTESGLPPKGDYCVRVRSDAAGLGYTETPDSLWPSTALRSLQVHTNTPALRTALHEIVHTWAAYIELTPGAESTSPPLRHDAHHWADFFDYGSSCMNESKLIWLPASDGTFKREFHKSNDPVFGLCSVDLYLMGLSRRDEVGKLRFFSEALAEEVSTVVGTRPSSLLPERAPALGATAFRQTWIVVTADANKGSTLAAEVATKLNQYEMNFFAACQRRATLTIARAKG